MSNLLSIVTFMPALSALILTIFLRGEDEAAHRNAKWVAMLTTVITFLVSLFILAKFDPTLEGFQMQESRPWVAGVGYRMGVDGLSVAFVLLTTFLMPAMVAASWRQAERVKEYMVALLLLETLILGAFMALDLVLFFAFAEAAMLPAFLLIGIWGGKDRAHAAFRMILMGAIGAVPLLLTILAIHADAGSTDLPKLMGHSFDHAETEMLGVTLTGGLQTLLMLGFLISFAIRLPIWPLHGWFPESQSQMAPVGAALMAALVVKLGGFGLLRFAMPLLPVGFEQLAPVMMWAGAIGVIYCGLAALVQDDIRRALAYGAVAHMGYVAMGIADAGPQSLDGALFHMVAQGGIVAALFLCAGVLHDRMKTGDVSAFGGLIKRMPGFGAVFLFFLLAGAGLPGAGAFVGEFLMLAGITQNSVWAGLIMGLGIILAASWAISLYRRVVFGDMIRESLKGIRDLDLREKAVFGPLMVLTLVFGLYPASITDLTGKEVARVAERHAAAVATPPARDAAPSDPGQ